MGEERKIGMQIGSGNLALASFRVIGQFASSDVIRLSDGRGSYPVMPSLIHFPPTGQQPEIGRSAKLKLVKQAEDVCSPVSLLAQGADHATVGECEFPVVDLISKLVAELREQAGLFGDFALCSLAYPDYLNSEQLAVLKAAVRAEIPEMQDKNFLPASFAVLFDMQVHQARYNLGYHKFDFSNAQKVLVVDIGENFTAASLLEVKEVGQDLEAKYLAKPCSVRVGGKDFDARFADYIIDQACLQGTLTEQELTPQLHRQIESEAERFKRDLVEKVDAQVISTHLPPGKLNDLAIGLRVFGVAGKKVLECDVTKQEYDSAVFTCVAAIHEGVPCLFQTVTSALNAANLRPSDVDEVILVGGMARLHLIGQLFKHVFGKVPREFASPELSAVRGASIYHDMVSSPLEMHF